VVIAITRLMITSSAFYSFNFNFFSSHTCVFFYNIFWISPF
jgi:hypothetical protein